MPKPFTVVDDISRAASSIFAIRAYLSQLDKSNETASSIHDALMPFVKESLDDLVQAGEKARDSHLAVSLSPVTFSPFALQGIEKTLSRHRLADASRVCISVKRITDQDPSAKVVGVEDILANKVCPMLLFI